MKKTWLWLIISLAALLAACSSAETTEKDSAKSEGKEETTAVSAEARVEKIIVGTGTQFPNVCFIDENGNLTGYDVELVKAIDEKLPEYEFEFKTMEFSNLLLSLETNKIDFIAHQMEVNEERQEKFLFNKEPYNVFPLKVTVNQNNNEINSVEDLKGKKVGVTPTSSSAVVIEDYNEEHDLGAEVIYGTGSADFQEQLKTGRIDAIISTPFAVDFVNEHADAQQKVVGEPLLSSKVYFLLNKKSTALSDRIDEALKELKEEGVVRELSVEWLGADYTVDF
ncbi:amino acid ABC transporter substrate-binding protein [Lysinibacillus yapensis]|uniref:Amino acid ABC transporter substrate-binding protein n=1 Tax=Ureibacillus yapensis TaxID=2304605 RepID=A0A396S4W6_9BACL|nr:transporter substrate-binding domain-containing protein [Lysinibacillus yapensis]RHW34730.1 amino acid ABC transporter substrate-binding protein [Lysinibacillus yapensis]